VVFGSSSNLRSSDLVKSPFTVVPKHSVSSGLRDSASRLWSSVLSADASSAVAVLSLISGVVGAVRGLFLLLVMHS
jgi:hypothetical protein